MSLEKKESEKLNIFFDKIYRVIIAICFGVGFVQYFIDPSDNKKNSILWYILMAAIYWLLGRVKKSEKRQLNWSRVFCFLYFFFFPS